MSQIIDLFAGAGGMSLGAARAGFHVAAALELDDNAIASHTVNFPQTIHIHEDIRNISSDDILNRVNKTAQQIDGIIGGPPCQGFSSIGHGNVDDERNSLFIRFFQIVSEISPVFFVAENVPGIMKDKYKAIRERAFEYTWNYNVLEPLKVDASDYGAPTNRTRYFFVGIRKDISRIITCQDFIDAKVTNDKKTVVYAALEGLPIRVYPRKDHSGIRTLKQDYFDMNLSHLQSDFFYKRTTDMIPIGVGCAGFISRYKNYHETNGFLYTAHTVDVKERFRHLKYGESDRVSKAKRLDPFNYCPTLRAGTGPDRGSYQAVRPVHYKMARVINPREAARLQGFPDWYQLPDTIWHSFRQLGNSVSPIVAEAIMSVIFTKLYR